MLNACNNDWDATQRDLSEKLNLDGGSVFDQMIHFALRIMSREISRWCWMTTSTVNG